MTAERQHFDRIVENFMGSPLELRDLLIAAMKVAKDQSPLPPDVAKAIKSITDTTHKTYASAYAGLLSHRFEGTANFWLSFAFDGEAKAFDVRSHVATSDKMIEAVY